MNYKIVIPVRKGSKRFPGKNKALFLKKPLVVHSIEFALKSFPKEDIWVNTDDLEIVDIANKYGVNITIRPKFLGSDTASTCNVLDYQINEFLKFGIVCDAVILLQATNPLRPKNLIKNAINYFEKYNRNSLATFSKLNKKFGTINEKKYHPTNYKPGQRMQDLVPNYFESGLIYITKSDSIMQGFIITDDVFPYIYDGFESLIDIDEPFDLSFAEFLYKKKISYDTLY